MKKIIFLLLFGSVTNCISAQYLPGVLQNKTVNMQVLSSGEFVMGNYGGGNIMIVNDQQPLFKNEQFQLVPATDNNYYKILDQQTNKFITVVSGVENSQISLQPADNSNPHSQEFQFVAETQPGRFKIHSWYNLGGLDLILQVDPSSTGPTALILGKNITVGNSEHQKFDLNDLNPGVDPSTAIPSLANRFEGRTCGFTMKHNGFQLNKNSTTDAVYQARPFAGFDTTFKIEYTDETGWYKIKHKASGKYITIALAAAGVDVVLKADAGTDDNYQKFKFIIQANDSTYKIHTKFSNGISTNKVALVLEAPLTTTDSIRCARNITTGNDQNQQFIITKYLAPAAEFSSGFSYVSGKILSRPVYISSKESLALLEPYIAGTDTFVRIQSSPVYGEQSEWIFDNDQSGTGYRLRYGKTNQYLYLDADSNSNPAAEIKLKLKRDNDTLANRRYEFKLGYNTSTSDLSLFSKVGSGNSELTIDDDGMLVTKGLSGLTNYIQPDIIYLNLALPDNATRQWGIATNTQGHLISDSGIAINNSAVTHIKTADFSCIWHFVLAPDNHYWIRNNLTKQYIYNNGSNAGGAELKTTADSTLPGAEWDLIRDGNCFNIKNVSSGKFMALLDYPDPGQPVYQGLSGLDGERWVLTRCDYINEPALNIGLQSQDLLNPYSPFTVNATNDNAYKDKLMRNIGFPFEPSLQAVLAGPAFANSNLQAQGISINPVPNFYNVLKTALGYKYGYTSAQIDMALANYKLDTSGHRVQAVYALRSYILENLALRNRNTWTFDERELVGWLERKIKSIKVNYSARLQSSWEAWKTNSNPFSDNDLLFSDLLQIPSASGYNFPVYYLFSDPQLLSAAEYASVSLKKNYKNPIPLAVTPAISIPGGSLLGILPFFGQQLHREIIIAEAQNAANAEELTEVESETEQAIEATTETVVENVSVDIGKALSNVIGAASDANFPIAVVTIALQLSIMEGMEASAFVKFDKDVYARIARINNYNENVNTIIQSKRMIEQINLYEDMDIVLGLGERFTTSNLSGSYVFNGSGNWSNANNWSTGAVPVNPVTPNEIIIDHQAGGECVVDVPVIISNGTKLTVKQGKKLRVTSQLTVPSAVSQQ